MGSKLMFLDRKILNLSMFPTMFQKQLSIVQNIIELIKTKELSCSSMIIQGKGFQLKASIKDHGSDLIGHPQDREKNYMNLRINFSQLGKYDINVSLNSSTEVGLFEFKLKT
jgi:hypothetical protein